MVSATHALLKRSVQPAYGGARKLRNLAAAALIAAAGGTAAAEPVVIAALGDSLTQGYGLPQEDGLVPQLQTWLTERGTEARVINAGVSGDTTAGGLSRVAWTLTPEVDAMIVALGGNDLLRGIAPETARANLDGILAAAAAEDVPVLLVPLSAPGNYGPDYKAAFDAIYPDLARRHDALLTQGFFETLQDEREMSEARALMQPDGIHPNAEGVTIIVDALGPEVERLIEEVGDDRS